MTRVESAGTGHFARERDYFVGPRIASRLVDEAGREADGTRFQSLAKPAAHPREFLAARLALRVAHRPVPNRSMADQHRDVETRWIPIDRVEVAGIAFPSRHRPGVAHRGKHRA